MLKYIYKIEYIGVLNRSMAPRVPSKKERTRGEKELNALGEKGWELVSVADGLCTFRRSVRTSLLSKRLRGPRKA